MPTSSMLAIPAVIAHMHALDPSSVLDIGAGYGKYGILFREYLDRHPRVVAIEAWQPYVDDHGLRGIYDEVHVTDAMAAPDELLNGCDVAFLGDVIEHFTKTDGLALLGRIRVPVVLNTPEHFFDNGPGLPWTETHRSHWTRADLEATGRLQRFDAAHGGIVATLGAQR